MNALYLALLLLYHETEPIALN